MAELYHLAPTLEKGLGCFATEDIIKGTMILKETPQCVLGSGEDQRFFKIHGKDVPLNSEAANQIMESDIKWIENVMSAFNGMTKIDQEEYLKLYDKYEETFDLTFTNGVKVAVKKEKVGSPINVDLKNLMSPVNYRIIQTGKLLERLEKRKKNIFEFEKTQIKAAKILKVLNIFETNSVPNYVSIKMSRFNHSCKPNAVCAQFEDYSLIIAMTNIKAGEEITINNVGPKIEMKSRQERQQFLTWQREFICCCDLCKYGKEDQTTIAAYETFSKLNQEMVRLKEPFEKYSQGGNGGFMQENDPKIHEDFAKNSRKQVDIFKKMYQVGKEKKRLSSASLYQLLEEGFNSAFLGYQYADLMRSEELKEGFKKDCETFARTAEKFGDFLGNELVQPDEWKERYKDFELFFKVKRSLISM